MCPVQFGNDDRDAEEPHNYECEAAENAVDDDQEDHLRFKVCQKIFEGDVVGDAPDDVDQREDQPE